MELKEKVTLQDIADMAGISRNTVSKIINGRFNGSGQTRELVMRLIREHNYKGLGQYLGTEEHPERAESADRKTILLLAKGGVAQTGFFLYLVNEIQQNVEARGYVLMFYGLQKEELENGVIPKVIQDGLVDGIVCMEILHKSFIEKLVRCHIPTVFLEFCQDLWSIPGNYDVVLMNSEYPVRLLTGRLLDQGCANIGFVGDYLHCRGFYERYQGYQSAFLERGRSPQPQYCIHFQDQEGYGVDGKLIKQLKEMKKLPDAFVVANDSIAINLVRILQDWGLQIPEQIQIAAYDNIAEASYVKPPLTTVSCDQAALSQSVVECLLQRLTNPEKPSSVVYVESQVLYRQSTRL